MTAAPHFPILADEFAGKRVLVTGGTKGAGAAIVRRLSAAGARIATGARSAPPEGISPEIFVQADLSTIDGAAEMAAKILHKMGGADIIVHCLGGSKSPGGGFAALTDALWQDELNLNLLTAVRLDRALAPGMAERGTGVVIHVSSSQRRLPLHESTTAYAASKAALSAYSKALSKEFGPRGVRVNSIAPGWINTTAADALVARQAESAGTDKQTARQASWMHSAASRSGVRHGRRKWRNSWLSWPRIALPRSTVRNMSSTAEQCRRFSTSA